MAKTRFDILGGYDERFDSPGGGLVNLDMYKRACESPDTDLVIILGEGNFHQLHGVVAAGLSEEARQIRSKGWKGQYQDIRKRPYETPVRNAEYIGHLPQEALKFMQWSAESVIQQLG